MNWKDTLATVAPTLATALGGPLAGAAARMVAEAIGLPEHDDGGIEQAVLMADPATLARLKEAELAFEKSLKELGIEKERIYAGDRANARQRQVETQDRTPHQLAWAILFALFCVIGILAFVEIPPGSKETFVMLAGSLSTIAGMAATFFYGSSSGSDLKTKLLARKTDGAT